MLSDLLIAKKIKEGDVKAFESTFRRYYSSLYLYAVSITGRTDAAEEIVQELFYVIWRDRETLQVFRSLKAYLYGAVRNQSLQYLEHTNVRDRYKNNILSKENVIEASSPQEQLEYKELETLINHTLNKMPERRSKIFSMHRFEGRKYTEIAENLAVSVKTVEAEMTKALKTLREEIEIYIFKS